MAAVGPWRRRTARYSSPTAAAEKPRAVARPQTSSEPPSRLPAQAGQVGRHGKLGHVERPPAAGQAVDRRMPEVGPAFGPIADHHRIDHALGGEVAQQRPGEAGGPQGNGQDEQPPKGERQVGRMGETGGFVGERGVRHNAS